MLKQGHLQPVAHDHGQLLSISKHGDSTTSLGNLCQWLVILPVKKLFSDIKKKLLSFCLWPLPLVLPLSSNGKSLCFFFSSLSSSIYVCWCVLILLTLTDTALFWSLSGVFMCFLHWTVQNWTQYFRCVLTRKNKVRITSLKPAGNTQAQDTISLPCGRGTPLAQFRVKAFCSL